MYKTHSALLSDSAVNAVIRHQTFFVGNGEVRSMSEPVSSGMAFDSIGVCVRIKVDNRDGTIDFV